MTKQPGRTVARGYGKQHKALRRKWQPLVEAGRITCWRCQQPIRPHDKWVLGHDDDRRFYRGPEHQHCGYAANQHAPRQQPARALAFFD